MNILRAVNAPSKRSRSPTGSGPNITAVATPVSTGGSFQAEKLSAVYGCIAGLSADLGSLPNYVFNRFTNKRWKDHPVLQLLNVRPNVRMTPFIRRALIARSILTTGDAYDWIIRDPATREAVELIPLTGDLVRRLITREGTLWYAVTDPVTRELFYVAQEDICDYKDLTRDGVNGMSVLSYASETVAAGLAAQAYNKSFYEHGGQPSGILTVDADLTGFMKDPKTGLLTDKTVKDAMREEWEKTQGGAENAHRIAILDRGLKYQSLAISQKDSMFVEQQELTVADIARYFGYPLYKLQAGKQSYNANEQQNIDYVNSLTPKLLQREQEQSYKLLPPGQQERGWQIRTNIMALLRGNAQARANYYSTMRNIGAYSVNDIRALEDLPGVKGGDDYAASLNFVPLENWKELSVRRADSGKAGKDQSQTEVQTPGTEPGTEEPETPEGGQDPDNGKAPGGAGGEP